MMDSSNGASNLLGLGEGPLLHMMDFLSVPDLGRVRSAGSRTLTAMAEHDSLWASELDQLEQSLGIDVCFHSDKKTILADPNYIPSDWMVDDLKIPPRIRGKAFRYCRGRWVNRAEEYLEVISEGYFPHSRDRTARRHAQAPLVIPKQPCRSPLPLSRFCPETGDLEDLFYVDNGSRDPNVLFLGGRSLYLKREFPVECTACRVTLHNSRAVLEHCVGSYQHIYNSTPANLRVPSWEYIDPRHGVDYPELNAFKKMRALVEYKKRILGALRAVPMDAAGRRNMESLTEDVYMCA